MTVPVHDRDPPPCDRIIKRAVPLSVRQGGCDFIAISMNIHIIHKIADEYIKNGSRYVIIASQIMSESISEDIKSSISLEEPAPDHPSFHAFFKTVFPPKLASQTDLTATSLLDRQVCRQMKCVETISEGGFDPNVHPA